jgi:O-antigen ligase
MNRAAAVSAQSVVVKPARDFTGRLLLVSAVLLLVPHMTRMLVQANDSGVSPVKPRDYILMLSAASLLLILIRRPAFCLPALALLIVPALRILDAALLARYEVVGVLDSHGVFVMNLLSYFVVSLCSVLCLTSSNGEKIAKTVAVLDILVVSGSIYYESLGDAAFTTIPGRMAGFFEDPNAGPINICLMLGILFTIQPRFWWNMALVAVAAPAVALTFSRSGMSVFVVMILAYACVNLRRNIVPLLLLIGAAVAVFIGGSVALESTTRKGVVRDSNTESRVQAIYELDFDRLGSAERAKDLIDAIEAAARRPLAGYGTGSGTSSWQPHNQFVSVWLDLGLAGLLIYGGVLLTVTLRSARQGFAGFFCLIPVWLFIPCSQVLLDLPAYWFSAAVCCHVIYSRRYRIVLRPALTDRPSAVQSAAAVTTTTP